MTPREVAQILMMQHKGFNADGPKGVLRHICAAQQSLMACEAGEHVATDGVAAELPALATTSGNYGPYSAPTTMRMVKYVLIKSGTPNVIQQQFSDYGGTALRRKIQLFKKVWFGVEYVVYPYCRTEAATDTAAPRVWFSTDVDPGTSTDSYFLFGYVKPTKLTSLSTPFTMKDPWIEEYLIPAASSLIAGISHGDYVAARQTVAALRQQYQRALLNAGGYAGNHSEPTNWYE